MISRGQGLREGRLGIVGGGDGRRPRCHPFFLAFLILLAPREPVVSDESGADNEKGQETALEHGRPEGE
jgi:hypothetical protein